MHKSFSEYFAAERIAVGVERACFQSNQWGVEEKTWSLSAHDATDLLGSLLAIRLLPAEVQEMLEPMLDDFRSFLEYNDNNVGIRDAQALLSSLERKLQRVEELLLSFSAGGLLDVISSAVRANKIATSPLESFGNFVSALLFVAVALVCRMERANPDTKRHIRLAAPALVRLLHIVLGGDIQIDTSYASRGLTRIDVSTGAGRGERVELQFPPIPPSLLDGVRGLSLPLSDAIAALGSEVLTFQLNDLLRGLVERLGGRPERDYYRHMRYDYRSKYAGGPSEYLHRIIGHRTVPSPDELEYLEHRILRALEEFPRRGHAVPREMVDRVLFRLRDIMFEDPFHSSPYQEIYERFVMSLRDLTESVGPIPRQIQSRNKGKNG